MIRKWHSYVWTACGAGWFVLYMITQHVGALLATVGCLAVAGVITILEELI
jgi:hypothetical protein